MKTIVAALSVGILLCLLSERTKAQESSPPSTAEIKALLKRISEVDETKDFDAIVDVSGLANVMKSDGILESTDASVLSFTVTCVAQRLVRDVARNDWSRFDVRRMHSLADKAALVFIQQKEPQPARQILWVSVTDDGLKLYDWQDFRDPLPVSAEIGMLTTAALGKERAGIYLDLLAASRLPATESEAAISLMTRLADAELPPLLDNARWMLIANTSANLGDIAAAMGALERAGSSETANPSRLFLLSRLHAKFGDAEQAVGYADKALELIGSDATILRTKAEALGRLGRLEEAANVLASSLKLEPDRIDDLITLSQLLPDDGKEELANSIAQLSAPDRQLPELAAGLLSEADAAGLGIAAERLLTIAPKRPLGDYYLAMADRIKEDHQNASEHFKVAVEKAENVQQRVFYTELLIASLLDAGRPMDAYGQVSTPSYAFQQVATYLVDREDAKTLAKLVAEHRKQKPDDPWIGFYEGELLLIEGRYEEAAAKLSDSLTDQVDAFVRERLIESLVFAQFKGGKGLDFYRSSKDKETVFNQLAALLHNDEKADELLELIELHREQTGADKLAIAEWEAEAQLLKGDYEAAAAAIWHLIGLTEDEETQNAYTLAYVDAMVKAGHALSAYQRIVDSLFAFRVLADKLANSEDADTLEKLLKLHGENHPDDPEIPFHSARLLLLRKEFDLAAKQFATAAETLGPDNDIQETIRRGRVYALYRSGQASEAYEQLKPQEDVFKQLVDLYVANDQWDDLESLVAHHRETNPDDPTVVRAQCELHWEREEFEQLVKLMSEHADTIFSEGESRVYYEGRMIRSLCRLKRFDEAEKLARQSTQRDEDPWYEAVVAAHRGNVELTGKLIETAVKEFGYETESIYQDPDLGELLRSAEFESVRNRYPPQN